MEYGLQLWKRPKITNARFIKGAVNVIGLSRSRVTFSPCFYPLWAKAFTSLQSSSFAAICGAFTAHELHAHAVFSSSAAFRTCPDNRGAFQADLMLLKCPLDSQEPSESREAAAASSSTHSFAFHMTLGDLERQSVLLSVEHSRIVCGMLTGFSSTFMTLRVGSSLCFGRHIVICIDCHLNSASY